MPGNDEKLLEKIRARVADGLAKLPNYTCRQTIERFARAPGEKKYRLRDRLRLDVALIGGRELYGWPGSSAGFEEKSIEDIVGLGGAIGTGNFASHLRCLFLKRGAEIRYAGEEQAGGRTAARFDFRMPRAHSEYYLGVGEARALVGYHGSFWADAATHELIRLEAYADNIPDSLRVTKASDVIEYGRVRIGETDFLLPRTAEMEIVSAMAENRNTVRFEGCRQYVGESVVSFAEAPAPGAAKNVRTLALPEGAGLELNLATAIDEDNSAVGDPVEAVLARPLRQRGETLLPKNTRFSGRITRMERRKWGAVSYSVVGLTLEKAEADGVRCNFRGTLQDATFGAGDTYHVPFQNNPGARLSVWTSFRHETAPPGPNEGVFYVRGETLRVPAGLRLMWRSAAREEGAR